VDARLRIGSIAESVTVSARASIIQTETAAVQHVATSEQLQSLPTSGRAFQSFVTLMPGVAQPSYEQAGGINNPGRTMSLTINGQPSTNTVVRLDGVTATNQYFEQLQSYSPGLEAIEAVSVVTSSMDADQGMAGAASVNVQVKSGTNSLRGSAFPDATPGGPPAPEHFLPAGAGPGHVEPARVRRHAGRADRPQQILLLRERRDDEAADLRRQPAAARSRHQRRIRLGADHGAARR